jgi:fibronectin-binding autotransporter adhesin
MHRFFKHVSRVTTSAWMIAGAAMFGAAAKNASAQYSWVNTSNQTGNWNATARWTGGPAGTFPNAADATATFNLPLSTAPSGNYNVQLSNTAGQSITVGGITVNNYAGTNDTANLRFGANGNGTLTFQTSTGSAFYTENAAPDTENTAAGTTNIFAPVTFLSNTVITQNHALNANGGTSFTSNANSAGGTTAAPGITVTKEGLGNVEFNIAPSGPGTGFQGAVIVDKGGVRDTANVFQNASGITVNSGGQYQLGSGTIANWNLATGAVLTLNGPGKDPSTASFDGALRFQNNAATANFNNPVQLASTSNIYVTANLAPTPPNPVTFGHLTLTQTVSGPGGLAKDGPGVLELTQANTYGGSGLGTVVNTGTLLANNTTGSATGSGPVTVNAAATLGGAGTVTGDLSVIGGILSPGNGVGTLSLGNTQLDNASTLLFDLASPNVIGGGVNDLVEISGNLSLAGTLNVTGLPNFAAGVYRLFDYTGTLTDSGLAVGSLPAGFTATIDELTPNQVNLDVSAIAPEPSSWILAALGSLAMSWQLARKRRATNF